MKGLTVKELREQLAKEDQDAVVAIENNGYPHTTTQMSTEGWMAGTFFMKNDHRIQKDYLMEDEIPADQKAEYIKVLVLGALISKDEVKASGVLKG